MTDPMTPAEIAAGREALCPHFEDHTPQPEGYIQWYAWAEMMVKTHRQSKCAGCGRYAIWTLKPNRRAILEKENSRDA